MDVLESRVYNELKDAYRKAVKNIKEETLNWNNLPIIFIDFYAWEVFYFEDEHDAQEHIESNNTDWDDSPPEGEDEELILIKFCNENSKKSFPYIYKDYKFFKEINGEKFYRGKSHVEFEPELVINVRI